MHVYARVLRGGGFEMKRTTPSNSTHTKIEAQKTDVKVLSHATICAMQSFTELRQAREQPGANQVALAPQEHRAFAREWTQENPLLAVPSLTFAIPGYAVAKKLGLIGSRTPASFEQMGQSYLGIWDGLKALSR